jgi:hypothetical protein
MIGTDPLLATKSMRLSEILSVDRIVVDSKPEYDDVFSGKNVDLPLRVQAGGEDLDQRRVPDVEIGRKLEHLARRRAQVLGETAVGVPTEE